MVSSIQIKNIKVYYLDLNKGRKTLLLIHGFAIDSTIWGRILPSLKHFHIICLDLPGYGLNTSNPRNADAKGQAQFLDEFMQVYGNIDCILGYSYGARVLYEYCKNFKQKAKKIIIVAAPFFQISISYILIRQLLRLFLSNFYLSKAAIYLGTTYPIYRMILKSWGITNMQNKSIIFETIQMIRRGNDPIKIMQSIADVFIPCTDGIMNYSGELTYVYGDMDGSATIPMVNRRIKSDQKGQLTTIRDAYHLIPLEVPEQLVKIIKTIVKSGD